MSTSSEKVSWKEYGFTTRAVHAGQEPDDLTGSVTVPIYQTSTFAQESPGKTKGFEYSRTGNPTRLALEKSIASLENAKFGLAFSSGIGAISTIGNLLHAGENVLICDDVYGGTYRVFTKVFSKFSIGTDFVDASKLDLLEAALNRKQYSFLLIESPTNPLMKVIDIEKSSKLAHSHGSKIIVDNTLTSPYLSNPLDMGADIVVHSTTKYLGGHSDVVGGAIATNDEKTYEELKFLQNSIGAVPGPFDCWLVLRGIKTLSLRMERHCENALAVARLLDEWKREGRIRSVNYPGLPENKFHDLASKQMRNFGGMLSFEMNSKREAISFLEHLKIFQIAESLGGVESLIELPATMTHASIPEKERLAKGVSDSLIRISVGIEDKQDLLNDLSQAMEKAAR
ncbi:MAG: PLP-dependent transferase [Nitrososphaerota archaeon]|nr:PLP-dependent transferase [Nitrososphaerota archaeon]